MAIPKENIKIVDTNKNPSNLSISEHMSSFTKSHLIVPINKVAHNKRYNRLLCGLFFKSKLPLNVSTLNPNKSDKTSKFKLRQTLHASQHTKQF